MTLPKDRAAVSHAAVMKTARAMSTGEFVASVSGFVLTNAQRSVLRVLVSNSHRLVGPGYVGGEVWSTPQTALSRNGYHGSNCSAPYARVAGKVLNGLKKLGLVEYVSSPSLDDWGWRITRAGVTKSIATIEPKPKARTRETDPCSRCNGSGNDPEINGCRCDCCGGKGVEYR